MHNVKNQTDDYYLPEGTMSIQLLIEVPVSLFGICLFDSGSTSTLINDLVLILNKQNQKGKLEPNTLPEGS